MITVDLRTLETARHTLVRQPQCPACGDPVLVAQAPSPGSSLAACDSGHPSEGGSRALQLPARRSPGCPPRQPVPRRGQQPGEPLAADDNGVTYTLRAPGTTSRMAPHNMDLLRSNLRGQSGGKGRTEMQARVSAVCEAIERYCGVWRGDRPGAPGAAYGRPRPASAVHPDGAATSPPRSTRTRRPVERRPGATGCTGSPSRSTDDRPIGLVARLVADRTTASGAARPRCWYGHPDLDAALRTACPTPTAAAGGNTPGGGDPAGLLRARRARHRRAVVVPPHPPAPGSTSTRSATRTSTRCASTTRGWAASCGCST